MPNASLISATKIPLEQQIRVVEQRLIARRFLLRNQLLVVRDTLHQTLTETVNVLLTSGVVFVLGYVASHTRSTTAKSQSASVTSPASRPMGVLSTLLRLITKGVNMVAVMLVFSLRIKDAVGMVTIIRHFFAPSSTDRAPRNPAHDCPAYITPVVMNRRQSMKITRVWLVASLLVITVVTVLIVVGWLVLSAAS